MQEQLLLTAKPYSLQETYAASAEPPMSYDNNTTSTSTTSTSTTSSTTVSSLTNQTTGSTATAAMDHITAPCFPDGYSETFSGVSFVHGYGRWTLVGGAGAPPQTPPNQLGLYGRVAACAALYRKILRLEENTYCNEAFHGQCSMCGEYQPTLPAIDGPSGE